ncbi:MAG: protein kinase domain-containing protein, partial [Halothece sp.]
ILTESSPQLLEQFQREALCLQLLEHSGIPNVELGDYFSVTPNNSSQALQCLVMELIEGENLEDWIASEGKISQSLALNWIRQILEILEYIHQNGFFHRDIKPSNIMRRPDDSLVLIDFGSVRAINTTYLIKIQQGEKNTTIISPGYSAPEQINGQALPQSDFYALGRTFVHLLTGKPPFDLPQDPKTGKLIWHQHAKQISQPFAEYIDELMATSPGERPQSTQLILKHLTENRLFLESLLRRFGSRQFRTKATRIIQIGTFLIILGIIVHQVSLPIRAKFLWEQGKQAFQVEDWESARTNLEAAVNLVPQKAEYRSDLGLACYYQKDFQCAIAQLQKALQLTTNSETEATIHYNLGLAYENQRKFDTAFKEYDKTIQLNQRVSLAAKSNVARLTILQKRQPELAIELILETLKEVEELPKMPDTIYERTSLKYSLNKNLGWAYFLIGEDAKAKEALEKAIALDNYEQAAPYCLLAKVEQKISSTDTLSLWRKCLNNDAGNSPEVEIWQLDAWQYLKTQGELP